MAAPDEPADTGPPVAADAYPVDLDAPAEAKPPAEPGSFAAAGAESGGSGSLAGELRELADDAHTLVEAELAYQSARAAYVWNGGKGVVAWLLIAAACAFFALVALVVGLLLALIPLLGVWVALAVVALGLVLCAGLALRVAIAKLRRIRGQAIAADPVIPPKGVATPEPAGPPTPASLSANGGS
jgi:hypothetical protein